MTPDPSRSSLKQGLPPGTLVHIGERRDEPVTISVITYDEQHYDERCAVAPESLPDLPDGRYTTWINVNGLHETGLVKAVGDRAGLHPLTEEDIVNTRQRPKLEEYDDYLYIVTRMLRYEEGAVRSEQVSLILGPSFVISFQERAGDVFDPIRERLRLGKGRIRKEGADYLTYTLLDAVVDGYFLVLEEFGDAIEGIEEEVLASADAETLQAIYAAKRELIELRRSVWPLREVVGALERGESPLIQKAMRVYLRDVYDHTFQVAETVETYRDTVAGVLDLYLSEQSRRMSEVMKVLTVIATIFIPLTFIAGVYGMNFQHMPELDHPWAYPAALVGMATVAIAMLIWFWRKRWI